jgi:hypothetical protein
MGEMTTAAKRLIERLASWPQEDIEKLEDAARAIEELRRDTYHATEDELRAIDEADASGVASKEDVEAAFKTFRRA